MDDIWKIITEKLSLFRERWVVWSVIGSGALYLLGYMVTRFQITVLGVGTGLDVLEEKYFFAGARFAVYFLFTLSSVVVLLLPVVLLLWLLAKLLRAAGGNQWKVSLDAGCNNFTRWWRNPIRLRVAGIIFSVLVIQGVMKQCLFLSNLLLANGLPGSRWVQELLLETSGEWTALYYAGLTCAAFITAGFYVAARALPAQGLAGMALEVLLALLLIVQVLLLPVNYSCFVLNKSFARVSAIGLDKVEAGRSAWLVWETDKSATFFVCNQTNVLEGRALVSIPSKEMEKIQITAYEPLFRMIFASSSGKTPTL